MVDGKKKTNFIIQNKFKIMASVSFVLTIAITVSLVFNINLCFFNCEQRIVTAKTYIEKLQYQVPSVSQISKKIEPLDCIIPYTIINKDPDFTGFDVYYETPDGQVAHVPWIYGRQALVLYVCKWDNSVCEVFKPYKVERDTISEGVWIRPKPNYPYSETEKEILRKKCG